MKARVRLTYSVEMYVEGESEEEIQDFLSCNTPTEAKELAGDNLISEDYSEEIISFLRK